MLGCLLVVVALGVHLPGDLVGAAEQRRSSARGGGRMSVAEEPIGLPDYLPEALEVECERAGDESYGSGSQPMGSTGRRGR